MVSYRDINPIMENQMEKKMENEMETREYIGWDMVPLMDEILHHLGALNYCSNS